jgi:hypothetical protein
MGVRASGRGYRAPQRRRLDAADIAHARQAGAGWPQPGRMPGADGVSGAGNGRARTGAMWARDGLRPGGAGTGRRDQHRDGRSGRPRIIRVTRLSDIPERSLESEVTGVQGRCALPRRRACGGRPCSSPRWSAPPTQRRLALGSGVVGWRHGRGSMAVDVTGGPGEDDRAACAGCTPWPGPLPSRLAISQLPGRAAYPSRVARDHYIQAALMGR